MALSRKEAVVRNDQSGMRIDLFLAMMFPELSRRKVRQILDIGGCYVNNKRMHIASRQVRDGDKVRVEFSMEGLQKSKRKTFEIQDGDVLYDDQHIIAINKPPGLPSQATRDQDIMHAEICVREWLRKRGRGKEKLILLHRLDKETSGVLLFATNPNTATWITDQFRDRKIGKTYWALCRGLSKHKRFAQECYLSDIDKKSGLVKIVQSGGKPSRTEFEVRATHEDAKISWIVCHPETGRSHQIRVHLEAKGLPIIGDKRYGQSTKSILPDDIAQFASIHHMLHAKSIEFTPAPNLAPVTINADVPPTFASVLRYFVFES